MQLAQLASCPWHATLSPPPSKSNLAEARSSYLTECLPFETKKTPCRASIIIVEIILSHRFARGSRRGSGRRPELPRLGAERPPRRAEPRTRGEAGCLSEPRHRQVRPSRQGGRNAEKRPLRAERPVLPRPGAAVLSARWGLTAEFGMGSGDPPLHGSARGRRSRGNRLAVRGGPGIPRATLAVACARHVHLSISIVVLAMKKSSGY